MSQSAKFVSHAVTAQRPIAQAPVAWGRAHARSQAPQLRASARTSTSQPLSALPSQS